MADRGKYAEGKVKAFLEDWKQAVAGFTYNRILDARSSLGAMSNPQPGDFQWFSKTEWWIVPGVGLAGGPGEGSDYPPYTRNGLIEVKEVFHDFRLPHKNFAVDQVGRMKIRQMAGSECIVITCHRVEGKRGAAWRSMPVDFFSERSGGSWDLSDFPAYTEVSDILTPYLS